MSCMKGFELNIGRACNSRCVFCVSRQVSQEEKVWLPLEKARDEVRLAFEQGCRALGFLGGEPTIYPHLEEVIRYGRELGYQRVALATNGLLLARAAVVEKLIDAGVTRFGALRTRRRRSRARLAAIRKSQASNRSECR